MGTASSGTKMRIGYRFTYLQQNGKIAMTDRLESLSRQGVIRPFSAYRSEEGFAGEPRTVERGAAVCADPNFWKEKRIEGTLVVRFLYNDGWFYVDRETFVSATCRTRHHGRSSRSPLDGVAPACVYQRYIRCERESLSPFPRLL
jgi:hypothetical protein